MNIASVITKEFITRLHSGDIPWHRPWKPGYSGAVSYGTGHAYSPVNQWRLPSEGEYIGVAKAIEMGLDFRGARRQQVVWYGPYDKKTTTTDPDTGEETVVRNRRFGFTVHNVLPIASVRDKDGKPLQPKHADPDCPSPEAVTSRGLDAIVGDYLEKTGIRLFVTDSTLRPHFDPEAREIWMLPIARFESLPAYYAQLFRLLVASTALVLDRRTDGDKTAAREELTLEMGSAMLLSSFNIDTDEVFDNSVAYASRWVEALSRDDYAVLTAGGHAEKAVNLILGLARERRDEKDGEDTSLREAS